MGPAGEDPSCVCELFVIDESHVSFHTFVSETKNHIESLRAGDVKNGGIHQRTVYQDARYSASHEDKIPERYISVA